MKILVISNLYPSRKNPFYGSFVANFVKQLCDYSPENKIELCALRGKSKTSIGKAFKYCVFYSSILRHLIFSNYDLIYVHLITHSTIPIRIVSAFKKLNLIFNIHGQDLLVTTPLASKLLELAKPMLHQASYIVVPSIFFKTITLSKLPDIDEKKIIVSASGGVNGDFFIKKKKCISVPVIGYVSRIDKGKGWDTFINAAKILTDSGINAKYVIVGGGQEVDMMNKLLTSLDLDNICYVGPKKYSELPEIYSTFDLFVFPTKLEESLGLVGLEAMAVSIPIIGSKIGGLTDYIEDEVNGYFFQAGDATDLAKKIDKYITLPPGAQKHMSEAAFQTAKKYEASVVSKKLFDRILHK